MNKLTAMPMLEMPNTACDANGKVEFAVYGSKPEVSVVGADGKTIRLTQRTSGGRNIYACVLPEPGQYDVKATVEGRTLTGMLVRPKSWQWAMERAREGALKYHQKATSHIESWYGFHSSFIVSICNDFSGNSFVLFESLIKSLIEVLLIFFSINSF